jgi:hypothetical protein
MFLFLFFCFCFFLDGRILRRCRDAMSSFESNLSAAFSNDPLACSFARTCLLELVRSPDVQFWSCREPLFRFINSAETDMPSLAFALQLASGMIDPTCPLQLEQFFSAVFEQNHRRAAGLHLILESVASMAILQEQKPVRLGHRSLMVMRSEVSSCCRSLPSSFLASILSLFASSNEPILLDIVGDVFKCCLQGVLSPQKKDLFCVAVDAVLVAAAMLPLLTEQCIYAMEHGDMVIDQSGMLLLLLLVQQSTCEVQRSRIFTALSSVGDLPLGWCSHEYLEVVAMDLADYLLWCSQQPTMEIWSCPLLGTLCKALPPCASQIVPALIARVCDCETPVESKLSALRSLSDCGGLSSFLDLLYAAVESNCILGERLVQIAVPLLAGQPDLGHSWLRLFQKMLGSSRTLAKFAAVRGMVLLLLSRDCDAIFSAPLIDWLLKDGIASAAAHFYRCLFEELVSKRPSRDVLSAVVFCRVFSAMLFNCESLVEKNVVSFQALEARSSDVCCNLLLATRMCIACGASEHLVRDFFVFFFLTFVSQVFALLDSLAIHFESSDDDCQGMELASVEQLGSISCRCACN